LLIQVFRYFFYAMQQQNIKIHRLREGLFSEVLDCVTVEEPLELVLAFGESHARQRKSLSVTMRTPSVYDFDLAMGFLFTEGVIKAASQVASMRYVANANFDNSLQTNVLQRDLHANIPFDIEKLQRHFYTSSSCGVCGKASIDLVQQQPIYALQSDFPTIHHQLLYDLPQKLRHAQAIFDATGGLHAAALFDSEGSLIALREDVGRHNALDKLIGFALKEGIVPLREKILLLSGRISFELVQKAVLAGIPIVAAIGAPSSLAIALAEENAMTLIGFLRADKMNIYSGKERIL
jgi:FdhD protein